MATPEDPGASLGTAADAAHGASAGVKANSGGEVALEGNKKSWSSLFRDNRIFENDCKLDKVVVDSGPVLLDEVDVDELKTWGHCLVGFVAGRFPGRLALENLSSSWGVPCQIIIHPSGWVIFRFHEEEHKLKVLGDGPHSIFSRPMIMKDMPGYFDFNDKFLSVVPCWVNLPGLPLECWNKRALSKISSAIGTPITMDRLTARRERIAYARVLVEVDTSGPIVEFVEVRLPNGNLLRQEVKYETMPMFCTKCKRIGHLMADCRNGQPQGAQQSNRARSMTRRGRQSRGASRRPPPRGDGNPGTSGTKGTEAYLAPLKGREGADLNQGSTHQIEEQLKQVEAVIPSQHGADTGSTVRPGVVRIGDGVSRDLLLDSVSQNSFSILEGSNVGFLETLVSAPVSNRGKAAVRSERGNVSNEDVTPTHKASLKQAVTETPDPHVAHEGTPSLTAPLQVEKAITEMHDSKTKKGSATSYVMDEDIFNQKVWELVDEDSRDNILAFLKKLRKLDPVCSEEELQTDSFIAKVLELVRKHQRHAFIARLEEIAREREAEETTEDSDDSISEDPKDECEMDWTTVGRGGLSKSRTRGRGRHGNRGRRGR